MSVLSIYVDDEPHRRLITLSKELGRSVEDLAECAVSEAALDAFRGRPTPPKDRAHERD